MEILFSIIVPIYNVSDYICECIDSLVNQYGNKDYEIILVDDGSIDGSGEICDKYSCRYDYIRAYHKENGGVSSTRNYGVEKAEGKYIIFVDGDDYVDPKMLQNSRDILEKAVQNQTEIDVLLSEGNYEIRDGIVTEKFIYNKQEAMGNRISISGEEMLLYTLPIACNWAPWGKVYKREYWNKNNYVFGDYVIGEDMQIIDRSIYKAQFTSMIPPFIYYRYRKKSLTHGMTIRKICDISHVLEDWDVFFSKNDVNDKIEKMIRGYLAKCYNHGIISYVFLLDNEDQKEALEFAKRGAKWMSYDSSFEGKMVSIMGKIMGVSLTAKILSYIKKKRIER